MFPTIPVFDYLRQAGDSVLLALGAGLFVVSGWLTFRRKSAFDHHHWEVRTTDLAGEGYTWGPMRLSDALDKAQRCESRGMQG